MPAFFGRKKYCHKCKKGYDKSIDHLCPDSCKLCRFPNCPIVSWIDCADCKRKFKSEVCFNRHKEIAGNAKSVCNLLVKCSECHKTVGRNKMRPELHNCGFVLCALCEKYVHAQNHKCYMPLVKERNTIEHQDTNVLDTWRMTAMRMTRLNVDTISYYFLTLSVVRRMEPTKPICV